MAALVKYDAACRAIAEAKDLREIRTIRDNAEAMRSYARIVRNRKLEIDAAEIRLRAERRLGAMIDHQKRTVGLNPGAKGNPGGRGAKIVRYPEGRAQPALSEVGVDHKLSSRAQRLAKVDEGEFEARVAAWRTRMEMDGERISLKVMNGTIYSKAAFTDDDEWHTPAAHVERVREFLGEIDLDPATSKKAQRTVRAKRFYTKAEDGLRHSWKGRVYLNAPYSRDLMPAFIGKLVDEFTAGNVSDAVCLTHNYTDTMWFRRLAETASAFCFTHGRVKFLDPDGNEAAPTQGQAFTYLGRRTRQFAKYFGPIGFVVVPA